MTTLTFQNTELSVINHNNQIWFTTSEVGKGLGYSDHSRNVKSIYERHADEFTPNMTALVDMQTAGGMQKVRVFSLRGTHLIAMFSHTKVAKDFRKWVLDILDKEISQNQQQNLPLAQPEPTYSRTLTERQWLKFASLWFACYNNLALLGRIYPPLEALGSRLGVEAYTHCTEYRTTLEVMKRILEPMLAEFDVDPRKEPHYYRALRTLREFELKGLGAVVKI